jgi:hypothetical protein
MPSTQTSPRLQRKWVKLAGSDFRLVYPQKIIRHARDCTCHPLPNHWHYEDDKSHEPERVSVLPVLLEDNGEGTYTQWSFGLFGPLGHKGTLKDGDAVQPLISRTDINEARCYCRAHRAKGLPSASPATAVFCGGLCS